MARVVIFVHPSLDLFDSMYEARKEGQQAGISGYLAGENPYPCECHRAQWDRGWVEGNALFARTKRTMVIRENPEPR